MPLDRNACRSAKNQNFRRTTHERKHNLFNTSFMRGCIFRDLVYQPAPDGAFSAKRATLEWARNNLENGFRGLFWRIDKLKGRTLPPWHCPLSIRGRRGIS